MFVSVRGNHSPGGTCTHHLLSTLLWCLSNLPSKKQGCGNCKQGRTQGNGAVQSKYRGKEPVFIVVDHPGEESKESKDYLVSESKDCISIKLKCFQLQLEDSKIAGSWWSLHFGNEFMCVYKIYVSIYIYKSHYICIKYIIMILCKKVLQSSTPLKIFTVHY